MSNTPASFSFPPPPPPPPRPSSATNNRGAPATFGSGGRGQPFSNTRGSFPPGRGRDFGRECGNGRYPSGRRAFPSHGTTSRQEPQKRSFGTAFGQNHQTRPQAPPAVPSFSAGLENLLPRRPTPTPSVKSNLPTPRKSNILGLTPAQEEGSDSEEDADEEARLAAAASGGDIQFEYRGHVSTLRTPTEIAAWIAERRKRYPTQAKRDAAQKEAVERKQRLEEAKSARQEAMRKAREGRDENRKSKQTRRPKTSKNNVDLSDKALSDPKEKAKLRTEKLRRKLERAERDLVAAEADVPEKHKESPDLDSDGSISDTSTLSDSDATSSSGSDSDSDLAPEETSSKIEQPALRRSPEVVRSTPEKVCSFFAKGGQCKFGKRCRYAHVRPEKTQAPKATRPGSTSTRKGLWQVMVEKEEEEEQKRVLRAIIALGEAGMLEEPKT